MNKQPVQPTQGAEEAARKISGLGYAFFGTPDYEARMAAIIQQAMNSAQPQTNDAGLLSGPEVYCRPLGNGWSLVWKKIVGEDFVQLVDANDCPLLEGWVIDANEMARSLSALPPPPSVPIKIN